VEALDFPADGHSPSNVSQAADIDRAGGLSGSACGVKLYEARKITKRRATTIKTTAEGSEWHYNRAPYLFSVLSDVLGVRHSAASP
jgi:hypothetical protein